MPLVRIALRRGKPAAWRTALQAGIYAAMTETFGVPADDRFMIVSQHDEDEFFFDPTYLGIARSADLVIIQITANTGRSLAQKKALYAAIADRLGQDPGLRPEDVFVNIVEVGREDWSFGMGVAQYATDQ